jgi:hypothetical protein
MVDVANNILYFFILFWFTDFAGLARRHNRWISCLMSMSSCLKMKVQHQILRNK